MNRDLLVRRANIIQSVREFFISAGFLEVDTPILSPCVIPEPTIELFETDTHGLEARHLYLLPSPELWMKRLLADGSGNIFQIARCFRKGEESLPIHSREFLMLEWYEVDADYYDAISTVENLLNHVLNGMSVRHLMPPSRRLLVQDAFLELAGVDLCACGSVDSLAEEAKRLGLQPPRGESWDELYHRIFVGVIEEKLPKDKPLILEDYPRSIACLAKPKGRTMWRERWELYLDGIEIANCYSELIDYDGVTELFAAESQKLLELGRRHQIDRSFPEIYQKDHPRCTGTALGLDRLIMLLLGKQSIAEIQPFNPPWRMP